MSKQFMHTNREPIMTNLLNELIFISQPSQELSFWPLLAASVLVAASVLRRRRPD